MAMAGKSTQTLKDLAIAGGEPGRAAIAELKRRNSKYSLRALKELATPWPFPLSHTPGCAQCGDSACGHGHVYAILLDGSARTEPRMLGLNPTRKRGGHALNAGTRVIACSAPSKTATWASEVARSYAPASRTSHSADGSRLGSAPRDGHLGTLRMTSSPIGTRCPRRPQKCKRSSSHTTSVHAGFSSGRSEDAQFLIGRTTWPGLA